jgi:hypothetical protein
MKKLLEKTAKVNLTALFSREDDTRLSMWEAHFPKLQAHGRMSLLWSHGKWRWMAIEKSQYIKFTCETWLYVRRKARYILPEKNTEKPQEFLYNLPQLSFLPDPSSDYLTFGHGQAEEEDLDNFTHFAHTPRTSNSGPTQLSLYFTPPNK